MHVFNLDFQIVSKLNELLYETSTRRIVIVSNDKGFNFYRKLLKEEFRQRVSIETKETLHM